MPPISSTGVMIGSTASNFHFQSATNSATIAMPAASAPLAPALTASQITSGNAMTTASSSAALPTRLHRNLMSAPQLFLCAKYATVSIIRNVMTMPGRMPARNSWPIDTLATMP